MEVECTIFESFVLFCRKLVKRILHLLESIEELSEAVHYLVGITHIVV